MQARPRKSSTGCMMHGGGGLSICALIAAIMRGALERKIAMKETKPKEENLPASRPAPVESLSLSEPTQPPAALCYSPGSPALSTVNQSPYKHRTVLRAYGLARRAGRRECFVRVVNSVTCITTEARTSVSARADVKQQTIP